jgi:hypothetical protein
MDNQDEVPYLEVNMPERFLLQFRLDDGRWMDEAVVYGDALSASTTAATSARSSATDSGFAASPTVAITSSM